MGRAGIFEAAGFTEYDLSNLRGSGVGDFSPSPGGARNFEAYSFTECGALKPPPPPGSSFSSGRKGCKRPDAKDHLRGTLSPLKIPLWGSPLAVSPTPPRPDSLVVTAGVVRARWPFLLGGPLRSQRYIRYEPRVRVSAGWHALTVPGAAQRCGTTFQRLVCEDPPVRKCLRISESVRAVGAHKGPRRARPYQGSTVVSIWPSGHSVIISLPS